jgi:hypothetical protein
MSETRESIRSASRLAANEGAEVELQGLVAEVAGRTCMRLDRSDAIVPLVGPVSLAPGAPARATGRLVRHADANDPITGLSSLELRDAVVDKIGLPRDDLVRTAPHLHEREGQMTVVEGLAYSSLHGNVVILLGGAVYVPQMAEWSTAQLGQVGKVNGRVEHAELPPDAPAAGDSWILVAGSSSFRW